MNEKNLILWQIKTEYQSLLSCLYDTETGEINEEVEKKLNELSDSGENKCIAIQKWILNLESEKKQIEIMEEQLALRKSAYEKEIEKRYNYLESNMKGLGIKEISCPYFKIRLKTNPPSTDILDEKLIPEKFIVTKEITKTERKPDRMAIKEEVLKTGVQVPGAFVHQKTKLEISFKTL